MSEEGPHDLPMAYWPEVRAMAGAREVLAALSKSYVIAVAPNATVSRRDDIARALERVGLAQFVSEIFCYTDIGSKKDEAGFWEAVLARLKARSDEVIMVGDSLEQDVIGPHRMGVPAIWFNWKGAAEKADGVVVIHSLTELPGMLEKFRNVQVGAAGSEPIRSETD